MNDHLSAILIMVTLVAMSAFFSATETAFSSINKTRLKALAEEGSRGAATALELAHNYDRLISTILIGNNIVNIAVASVATLYFVRLCGQEIGATVATIAITLVVLVFGEISPKSIAKDCPEKVALFAAPVMRLLVVAFTPANYLFSLWKRTLSRILRLNSSAKMSQAELLMLVDEVQQDGSIDDGEGEMLRNVIAFTDQEACDILTPRVDLVALPETASKEEVARKFAETKFSRLLIYRDSIDSITGVIHLKDFYTSSGVTSQSLTDIMMTPIYTHESAKLKELLKQLQASKSHVAVINDEYGGTSGIVTMEDILEQLVGDIWDEHEDAILNFRKTAERTYAVDGSLLLTDFCKFLDVKNESEATTVSGWVMEQLQRLPEPNDSFHFNNFTVTVTKVDNRRVKAISVALDDDAPVPVTQDDESHDA